LKNKPEIGRRPIKGEYYIFDSILMKNEPKIGKKPIKRDFKFNFVEKKPKIGRRLIKRVFIKFC
jgi:hypothetical protein